MLTDSRARLSRLSSEDDRVQGYLDSFRKTLWLSIEHALSGTNTFDMLEGPLVGLISNIHSLGSPELAEDMSAHLTITKSLLDELNQTKTSDGNTFASNIAIFYVMTRDAIRVQLRQQIADETSHLKNISRKMKHLKVSSEEQEVKYEAVVEFICLSEKTIRQLEDNLARSRRS